MAKCLVRLTAACIGGPACRATGCVRLLFYRLVAQRDTRVRTKYGSVYEPTTCAHECGKNTPCGMTDCPLAQTQRVISREKK